MDTINKIIAWIKGNLLLAVGIALGAVILFFPKLLKSLFSSPRRRRRGPRKYYVKRRRVSMRKYYNAPRRRLPRSVSTSKKRLYSKGGKKKKPWQIKGSIAARRHMAQLRRMR